MQYTLLTRGRINELQDIMDLMGYDLIAARFVPTVGLVLIIEERMLKESFLIGEKDIIKKNILGAKKIKSVDLKSTDEDIIRCLEESEEESDTEESVDLDEEERCMLERRLTQLHYDSRSDSQ